MARRLGDTPIGGHTPTKAGPKKPKPPRAPSDAAASVGKTKGKRRPLGTDSFTDQARTQSMLTPDGFHRRTGINIEQALKDLGPTIRNMALDDSNMELLVAWGRCAEKRLGMALYIEDTIRAMKPADAARWRLNICQCALGVWYNADERV